MINRNLYRDDQLHDIYVKRSHGLASWWNIQKEI